MIFRVIALSFALLIGIGAIVPLATDYAEAGQRQHKSRKKKLKQYKKYSKQWWRAYHRSVRQKKAVSARRRMLRLRRIRLANRASVPELRQKAAPIAPADQTEDLFILVEGTIKKVYDGHTIRVKAKDGEAYLIRMLGIRAPETRHDFGDKSRKNLSDLILGKNVTVVIRKKDASERYFGTVYYGGEDVNLRQIETGMARYFPLNGYAPKGDDRRIYQQAERRAQAERSGLWIRQAAMAAFGFQR